ncbi:MAG: glycosyl hydrolase, partial [Acidobacteria bacterium]|nr:glycosyl hydrolase [Acidobacteriota bacterium]
MRRRRPFAAALVLVLVAGVAGHASAASRKAKTAKTVEVSPIDARLLAGLELRSIGPATMSGRVAAVEGVPSDPDVIYVGAATGGVWKSVDGGVTWAPIFDDQPVAAIGAIAVNPVSPEVVWVGTGEGNPRNSVSVGNGAYRSLDGGATWEHLGLDGTERIARIVLDPGDPDVAYVAAMGPTWG